MQNRPDLWAERLSPITQSAAQQDPPKPFYFIASNRIGAERGAHFSGSSIILNLSPEVTRVVPAASAY